MGSGRLRRVGDRRGGGAHRRRVAAREEQVGDRISEQDAERSRRQRQAERTLEGDPVERIGERIRQVLQGKRLAHDIAARDLDIREAERQQDHEGAQQAGNDADAAGPNQVQRAQVPGVGHRDTEVAGQHNHQELAGGTFVGLNSPRP